MRRFLDNRWLWLAARFAIGGLFVYAGVAKLQQPQLFADSVATFQVLPEQIISLWALSLPPFEVITGTLLIMGWWRRAAAFSILVLTVVLALALSQALIRGLNVDCGCFGAGKPAVWKTWTSLGRDLLLMAVAGVIYRRACLDNTSTTLRLN